MKSQGTLKVTTPTDREIVMIRDFDAPRRLVFDALTKPELLKRWCFGPDGWSSYGYSESQQAWGETDLDEPRAAAALEVALREHAARPRPLIRAS